MRNIAMQMSIDLPSGQLIAIHRAAPVPAISEIDAAVRNALEHPQDFPALRRALTPDDHVAVLIDQELWDLPRFLTPVLEHLIEARILPETITLIGTQPPWGRDWVEHLPAAFAAVNVELHDSQDRKRLSYLATTKHGRRVYLNRTAVDADQLVVLSRRTYDPMLGIGGGEGALYPGLSDAATQREARANLSMAAPPATGTSLHKEAVEIAWLLGAPFFVHVIEGSGDDVAHIVGGVIGGVQGVNRLLDARWRIEVNEPADVVFAEVGDNPDRHSFADWARSVACAARVVRPQGRIILLSEGTPELGPSAQLLRQANTPDEALHAIKANAEVDLSAAFQWASAAHHADLYVMSGLPGDVVEELFATPLQHAGQAARIAGSERCLVLPDASKTLATCRKK